MHVAPRGPGVRQRPRERDLRPLLRRLQEHRVFHQERAGTEAGEDEITIKIP